MLWIMIFITYESTTIFYIEAVNTKIAAISTYEKIVLLKCWLILLTIISIICMIEEAMHTFLYILFLLIF